MQLLKSIKKKKQKKSANFNNDVFKRKYILLCMRVNNYMKDNFLEN